MRIRILTVPLVALAVAASAWPQPTERAPAFPGLTDVPGPGALAPRRAIPVRAVLVPQLTQATAGQTFHVAVDIRLDGGWVYYGPRPGTPGGVKLMPAKIEVSAGELKVGKTLWPPAKQFEYELAGRGGESYYGYKNRLVAYVPVTVPEAAKPGDRTIIVQVDGQVCKDVCISLRGASEVIAQTSVTVGRTPQDNPAWSADVTISAGLAQARAQAPSGPGGALRLDRLPPVPPPDYSVVVALAAALLAGLILNVMPCVLPIIPLRIYSLVNMAGESRRRFVTLGLGFAAGIVLFFAGVAAANATVKLTVGRALNWSEHWQIRGVRVGLGLLVVALATNLFGAFEITVPSKVAQMEGGRKRQGHAGAIGMGLMMAILATPCSAAFVIGILGWAQGQPLWLGTTAILLMGVGMAAPHAVLTAFPKLVDKLPKPGRWMELLKQTMGFVLLPVAVWLFSTLGAGAPWAIAYAVVLGFALWMWGRWVRYDAPLRQKLLVRGIAAVLAVAAGLWMLGKTSESPDAAARSGAATVPAGARAASGAIDERIAAAVADGKVAVVKFTADWCLECIVVERRVYQDPEVKRVLAQADVAYFVADVTDKGTPASDLLERMRGAPPLTAVFAPGGEPIYLPGGIGKDDLLRAVHRARQATGG